MSHQVPAGGGGAEGRSRGPGRQARPAGDVGGEPVLPARRRQGAGSPSIQRAALDSFLFSFSRGVCHAAATAAAAFPLRIACM